MPRSPIRRAHTWGALAGLSVCALIAATSPGTATAAPPAPAVQENCPEPFPQSELTEGQKVTGLTVAHGTEPDEITGTVVGVLEDGIAPGLDMIIIRMAGSEITDPETGDVWRGIWAGMSGSPVYAEDGRLIGAVSYGLSYSPSDYAGVTPAEEMYRILDYEGAAAKAKQRAVVPDKLAAKLKRGGATTQQVNSGFRQLPMPVTVSGLSEKRLRQANERFGRDSDRVRVGNGADPSEEPTPITAGGNLAASLSYGDISQVGTGTATAICDGKVLGFGHPFLLNGARGNLSMHGAKALYVETDTVDGSYKISNPTAPIGRISQDRTAGILGAPGELPPGVQITSHVAATNGNERDGSTTLTQQSYSDDVPYISALHLFSNLDRVVDQVGPGTGTVTWRVEMTRPDGSAITFNRTENFTSNADISDTVASELYDSIWQIQDNGYEKVRITDVDQEATVDDQYHAYKLDRVDRLVNGSWVRIKPQSTITINAGRTLELRARVVPRDGSIGKATTVRLSIPVGAGHAGRSGTLVVSGGASTSSTRKAQALPGYLAKLGADPRNDRVFATLTIVRSGDDWLKRVRAETPSFTSGTQKFTVKVK